MEQEAITASKDGRVRRHGLTHIGDHEIYALCLGDTWQVIVNDRCVDWLGSKYDAIDVVRRLTQALQIRMMPVRVSGVSQSWRHTNGGEESVG